MVIGPKSEELGRVGVVAIHAVEPRSKATKAMSSYKAFTKNP